jgi:rod shape-determining protein MreD
VLNIIVKNIIRFIILVLIQVLLVKNIELGRFINPFIYVLFILMAPFEVPKIALLFISFLLGLTIDMFYDTAGMHAAACVFMAFLRPTVLKLFSPRDGYEPEAQPTLAYLGISWFLSYSSILIFLHHFLLFYTEIFRFTDFFSTLARVIISTMVTLILVIISQYFFYSKKEIN